MAPLSVSPFITFSCLLLVAHAGCADVAADRPGDPVLGEGEGEGEGEERGFAFELDGEEIDGDRLILTHDVGEGSLTLAMGVRNTGDAELTILSDPPVLITGPDASSFAIPTQPAAVVPPGGATGFDLVYVPAGGGDHQALLVFAYGVGEEERAILTVDVETAGPLAESGVRYAIYEGGNVVLPDFSTLTPVETGVIDTFDISARLGTDEFAYTFDGMLQVTDAGEHTFFVTSDDGSRLFIDGAAVVDNDGTHGAREESGTVELAPGPHAIRVEFFQNLGGVSLLVEWQSPTVDREPIPNSVLLTD